MRAEMLEGMWKEKYNEWAKRHKTKLPKWFGERPGKKAGDPESPEGGEEEAGAEDEAEEEYDEVEDNCASQYVNFNGYSSYKQSPTQ